MPESKKETKPVSDEINFGKNQNRQRPATKVVSEKEVLKDLHLIPEVTFAPSKNKKTGEIEYKSSDKSRKIIVLAKDSPAPEPGKPYKVRVLEDSDPKDPMKGKYTAEIYYASIDERAEPILNEISEKQQKATSQQDWEEIKQLHEKLGELYKGKEKKERQMEFDTFSGRKIKVTEETEKHGYHVEQKVKAKKDFKVSSILEHVKDITIVGFNDIGDTVVQLDQDKAIAISPHFFNRNFELVEEKEERQVIFTDSRTGAPVELTRELEKYNFKVDQEFILIKRMLIPPDLRDVKKFTVAGFTPKGLIAVRLDDSGVVATFDAGTIKSYFGIT